MSLVARHLEANGIPTFCVGSALDILEAGRPPRYLFIDYPLGHSTGKPFDRSDQYELVEAALRAFEEVKPPDGYAYRVCSWTADPGWRAETLAGDGGDIRMARDTTPQYQTEADRRLAEGR